MWFNDLIVAEAPGRLELRLFVADVRNFLGFVLAKQSNFDFIWKRSPELYNLAVETYRLDVCEGAGLELDKAIESIPEKMLFAHGLSGRPLKFKFRVLDSIANEWKMFDISSGRRNRFTVHRSLKAWFKRMIDAIDAILDSLIDAAGGAGGLIKEFKDSLSALA